MTILSREDPHVTFRAGPPPRRTRSFCNDRTTGVHQVAVRLVKQPNEDAFPPSAVAPKGSAEHGFDPRHDPLRRLYTGRRARSAFGVDDDSHVWVTVNQGHGVVDGRLSKQKDSQDRLLPRAAVRVEADPARTEELAHA